MTATFQVGQILQGQQKFASAITAWKGYLAQFLNGPHSADAQRAILDTQLLIAAPLGQVVDPTEGGPHRPGPRANRRWLVSKSARRL
jgi:hypothetical protein